MHIPFHKAHIAGRELYYIAQAVSRGELKGDGPLTHKCNEWIEVRLGVEKALLTHSCTGALEMAALLLNLEEDDEVILPSYTFTSTANAFLLRGARPVFVDVRPDTLNIDETLIEQAITPRTKAICPMHYAGVGCEMDTIMMLAERHNLIVIEDAAHAIMAKYRGKYLGTIGQIGTYSFHETKNYSSGEGGALLLNTAQFMGRAEILREKGTNRSAFFRGEVDKYTWVDTGSSYLPSEIIAAFLYGQLERADEINTERLRIWDCYYRLLQPLAEQGFLRLPTVPDHCEHNAHMFYILLSTPEERDTLMAHLKSRDIAAVFHYVPLHLAPMGAKFGYRCGDLPVTEQVAGTILRLPFFYGLEEVDQARICNDINTFFESRSQAVRKVAHF